MTTNVNKDVSSKKTMYNEYLIWFGNLDIEHQVEAHLLSFEEFIADGHEKLIIDNCKKMLYNKEKNKQRTSYE